MPAIFPDNPDLNYHNLEDVHNGSEAMGAYFELRKLEGEERERLRQSLLAYCKLDTMANGFYGVQFSEGGKIYVYKKENIKILQGEVTSADGKSRSAFPFKLYSLAKPCWKCGKDTELLTYMVYKDNPRESLTYPWDKERLLKTQDLYSHMLDGRASAIEYYGLYVLGGDVGEYDSLIMKKYPRRVKIQYSKTVNSSYPMNVCTHCGAKQGCFFCTSRSTLQSKRWNRLKCRNNARNDNK